MSNVCELPHEYATATTMHVSIAVSSDRGMCKQVVRRGAGATAGTMMIEIDLFFFFSGRGTILNRPNRRERERERERVLAREFYLKNPTPPGAAQAT